MNRLLSGLLVLGLLATTPRDELKQRLDASAPAYLAKVDTIATVTSRDSVMDYYRRLLDDKDWLTAPKPSEYTPADWDDTVENVVGLDLSAASQLTNEKFRSLSEIDGLGEAFVRSSHSGKMEPVAVYVPKSYASGRPAPLIVFLHGRGQTESETLGPKFVRDLADRIGSIVVAPYGRGHYDFVGAESDIYDVYNAAESAFNIDIRKRYLVGYSMGGFSVFRIAPMHPSDWSAVMSIAGALLNSRARRVVTTMPQTPVYMLTGALDDNVPTAYPTSTAIYLRNSGVPVTFYSQPNGTHRLVTLLPILRQAWDDMAQGIVRTPSMTGDPTLPTASQ
jgi:pimeloyl-ACP methyl ester carboxylesterase